MAIQDDRCRRYQHHRFSGFRANLSGDIDRYLTMSPENIAMGDGFKRRLSTLLRPELQCLILHRVSHYLYLKGWRRTAALAGRLNTMLHKVHITPQSCIGPGCRLPHPPGVAFHGRAGRGLTLFSICICVPKHPVPDGPVELGPLFGDNITVGGHAVVLGPVRVGDDTTIGFSATLEHDAPAGVTVVSRAGRTRMHHRSDHTPRNTE